jgi:peptidoglycan-N-acetylglucosamine deacetylase
MAARRHGRREFLGILGLGAAAVISGCGVLGRARRAALASPEVLPPSTTTVVPSTTTTTSTTVATTTTTTPTSTTDSALGSGGSLPGIPDPHPGPPSVVFRAPTATNQIALTIDDGYCVECADDYVQFALRSGIRITFSPNGTYNEIWDPLAATLRPLIEAGQVQIANHTYNHRNLLKLGESEIVEQIERNEDWIEATFGITGRPWFRPPYGWHDERTDEVAGGVGYTQILMWSGSFGDSAVLTPDQLLAQAEKWLLPGTIMLGHANHPTVTTLFGQIEDLIAQRNLSPVTLDEMFGTSRAVG